MNDKNSNFKPMSTEEKKVFGKQFSAKEKASYRKGQENAYRHSANLAGHQAKFLTQNRQEK